MGRDQRRVVAFFGRNIFGKLEMNGAGPLLGRDPERLTHEGGDRRRRDDLARKLRQRLHRRDGVDHLKPGLARGENSFLPSEQDHRHRAQQRIRGAGGKVQRARPERRDADTGLAREPPVGRRHECRGLFVPREDQLDRGFAKRLHDVQILFAGYPEDAIHALVLERCDEQI